MSQQQREALDQIMRNGPLDIAGDPAEQRAIFERMLTARPLASDVTAAPGTLGGVPVLTIEAGETRTGTVLLWLHGGWYVMGSPRASAGLASESRHSARCSPICRRRTPANAGNRARKPSRSGSPSNLSRNSNSL